MEGRTNPLLTDEQSTFVHWFVFSFEENLLFTTSCGFSVTLLATVLCLTVMVSSGKHIISEVNIIKMMKT